MEMATNAQMGVSCIERNGILASNYGHNLCFSSVFPNSGRTIFGFASKMNNIAQNQVFGSRRRNCGAITVLLKGESGNNGLVDGGIIQKESEFKPSFDEYLKAMESLRSCREKREAHSSIRCNKSRNDSRGKGAPRKGSLEGDDDNGGFGEKFCGEKSKLLEQDELYKNSYEVTRREGLAGGNINHREKGSRKVKDARKMRFEEKSKPRSLVQNKIDCKQSEMDVKVKGNLGMDIKNGRWTNYQTHSLQENQRDSKLEGHSFRTDRRHLIGSGMSRRRERDHVQGEKVPYKNSTLKNVKLSGSSMPILEDSSNEELETGRVAFKSLEEHNDICDKPRVSRVDMEERIQKLAKCLNGADIDMPEWMFSNMMRSAKIRFTDHSMLRVIQILGKLGNWRRVLQVLEWIQLRERFKSHKIRYIYTAALDALGKARRPVEALNVFHAMQLNMSSYPDLVAYHCIAVTLGQAGHMKELFDVIDSMRSPPKKKFKTGVLQKWDPRLEPDIVVYNSVLNSCVRRKKWEGGFWVLQQLKQQGQQPSSTTYGLVMEVMFACGKYNLVHDFFNKVQKSSIPNALTYKVLVNTLWREGKIDEAVLVVRDMERRGIIGSGGLYYDLARCLCSAGRCQEALMQIDKICKVANKSLVVTYTGLIQACLDSGDIQSGVYVFRSMDKFCSPNLVTYNIMLKAYLDHEMFEEAKGLFQKLVENSNHISSNLDYKDRVTPDIYTFNLMLDACRVKRRWDDLECVYKRMLQHGYHFNAKRHLRMILVACRAEKVEILETAWKHLVQADQHPPPLLVKEMFRLKLEQDDYAAAFSCITHHPLGESQVFSPKSWLNFFRENSHRFQKETLVRLVHEVSILIARSESPNLIFHNLMTSCKTFLTTQMTRAEIDQTETVDRQC